MSACAFSNAELCWHRLNLRVLASEAGRNRAEGTEQRRLDSKSNSRMIARPTGYRAEGPPLAGSARCRGGGMRHAVQRQRARARLCGVQSLCAEAEALCRWWGLLSS